MNEEILYLIASLRDGSIDSRIGKNYEIKIGQKCNEWLTDILKPIIENNFIAKTHIKNNLLRITNKEIVEELQKISGIKSHGWKTPLWVRKLKTNERIPYIKGFWDAEGGLPKNPDKCKRSEQIYISFHQKMKEPLVFVRKTLIELGFKPTNITKCKGAHEFRITRKKHIIKYHKEIGSLHPEKGYRLNKLVEIIS